MNQERKERNEIRTQMVNQRSEKLKKDYEKSVSREHDRQLALMSNSYMKNLEIEKKKRKEMHDKDM